MPARSAGRSDLRRFGGDPENVRRKEAAMSAHASRGRFSQKKLVEEMWTTMLEARQSQQYATSSLTGERIAKIQGFWQEKPQPPPETDDAQREVIVYGAEPLSGDEWDRRYGS
jgi:hypothetical protein